MVRVSWNLRHTANLLFCAALASGCGSSDDGAEEGTLRQNLIMFSPIYSAFGGAHEYQLTPSVPIAADDSMDSDPIVGSTLKWTIDSAFAQQASFGELPASVLLTTKKAGTTTIKVAGTTKSGIKVRGESRFTITQASDSDWDAGDARYNNGMAIDFNSLRPTMAAQGEGTCGFPVSFGQQLPTNSACSNCHNSMSGWSVEHTPMQTAGYSDDELVNIFTNAQKPMGGTFNSPILKMVSTAIGAETADCIYKSFHTWEIDDASKRGIVLKLRSITPKPQADIDFMRLAMQARASQQANAGGDTPAEEGAAGAAP